MRIPQTFLPEREDLERKTEILLNNNEKTSKDNTDNTYDLEVLKKGRTKEDKKNFLKQFSIQIPELLEKVKEKMIQTKTEEVYLEKKIVKDYSAHLEISFEGHLEFYHLIYQADLDDKELYGYNGYGTIYDHLDTYPDKENDYYSPSSGRDDLQWSFKTGKEMYECIKAFLEK